MPGILNTMAQCYFCGHRIDEPKGIGRGSTCSSCGKDLKVCLNCAFYDTGSHWECRETISERVAEKDRANFCDYFVFSEKGKGPSSGLDKADKARSDVNKLFGDA